MYSSSFMLLIPVLTSFYIIYLLTMGKGNGNRLQYSCLENHMDRGPWWVTVHGVAKSWTQLKLKLQNFDHLLRRTDSFEKTLMLGKIEGRRRRE